MYQLIHYNMGSKSAIGIGNGICFKQVRDKGGGSYIDPLVRDSIVGLWKFDQNTNESPTRNIIKNTIKDKGGDLELLNFGYKLNSGYNGYPEDFTSWGASNAKASKGGNKAKNTKVDFNVLYFYSDVKRDVGPFKVKISNFTKGIIKYYYKQEDGIEAILSFNPITVNNSNGLIELPKSYNTVENGTGVRGGFAGSGTNIGVTIEQLPLYDGALVTDGKDDMIVSQKTVQEMLGGSKEITVVSMIHHINNNVYHTNYIRSKTRLLKNYLFEHSYGKSFIYGYTATNVGVTGTPSGNLTDVILGDKKDLYTITNNYTGIDSDSRFSIEGYIDSSNGVLYELSEVAVYWTFIANKVLTTDKINQIIAYYKLDKYITPQVIYDVKRQGLTNDTPSADWYLKDFSGNGHDMQLYNYAKKGNSGIGKYETDFTVWNKAHFTDKVNIGSSKIEVTGTLTTSSILINTNSTSMYNVEIYSPNKSIAIYFQYNDVDGTGIKRILLVEGINKLPSANDSLFVTSDPLNSKGITITQIPDYEGALVSDGKDDYGQFVGDLGLKDYTIAVDRAYVEGLGSQVPIISSIGTTVNTPFLMEYMGVEKILAPHSFGTYTALSTLNTDRFISYQSTYKYNGDNLTKGTSTDTGSGLTIGRFGAKNSQYAKLALWSFLLFPYSLSEFLLERQLKKYKLGTLYPDMVEFRPVVSGNIPYDKIEISQGSTVLYTGATDKTGIYLQEGSTVRVYIRPSGIDEVSKITINEIEYTDLPINVNGYYYADFPITKSPQKISYVIDEYIRFEDIVQPYPAIVNLSQDGKSITWGDKLKVGSELVFVNHTNLLPELYTSSGGVFYNGKILYGNTAITAEKSMVFTNVHGWKLNTTEPHAILSPQKLNIPNSSLKILGYVPDLTGKGNHGKLNNFAYTEDSGVASDGSIKFDGTDDHITIPTLAHGGKCVMMKVNLQSYDRYLYDQRNSWSQYLAIVSAGKTIAYEYSNKGGKTYIDGILNENIIDKDLIGITHNITVANSGNVVSYSPNIGTSFAKGNFANMSLYEFMLFPEIPSEDEIKKLNDVMGIEGGYVESPNYYWDAYGKKNTDTDRNLIADQVSKDVANALEVKNVAYNSESGYGYGKSNFISIMESSQQFVDIIDDYNFIIKATPHNNNQFFAQVNTPKLIPNNYIRFKVSGIPEDFKMVFGYDYVEGGANEYSHIIDKNGVYSYDSFNIFYTSFRAYTGYTDLTGLNIKVEFLDYHPNALLLDGVEDHAVNTVIPAVTDFTVIAKREMVGDAIPASAFVIKGNIYVGGNGDAFLMEYVGSSNFSNFIFGQSNVISAIQTGKISYLTPTSYNGTAITKGTNVDNVGLTIGKHTSYWKGVFYKMMLYTKTIDQLSINMLKNLFERDELIDVTNPIFKKEEL